MASRRMIIIGCGIVVMISIFFFVLMTYDQLNTTSNETRQKYVKYVKVSSSFQTHTFFILRLKECKRKCKHLTYNTWKKNDVLHFQEASIIWAQWELPYCVVYMVYTFSTVYAYICIKRHFFHVLVKILLSIPYDSMLVIFLQRWLPCTLMTLELVQFICYNSCLMHGEHFDFILHIQCPFMGEYDEEGYANAVKVRK